MNTNESIARQVAAECVATFCLYLNKSIGITDIKALMNYFTEWLLLGKDKDDNIKRQAALKRAVLLCPSYIPKVTTSKELLELANELYKEF